MYFELQEGLIFADILEFELKVLFQRLLSKQGGKRAAWEYPFAVAGINVTFMLIHMLDLCSGTSMVKCGRTF